MENLDLQNKMLRYTVLSLAVIVIIIGAISFLYISDTAELRREMLGYARETIQLEYERLRDTKDEKLERGDEELEQIEKLIDDYNNNSMELDDLLNGMEDEIKKIRGRS